MRTNLDVQTTVGSHKVVDSLSDAFLKSRNIIRLVRLEVEFVVQCDESTLDRQGDE